MTLKIDRDRMVVIWSVGNEDLTMALVELEGCELAKSSAGPADKFRCAEGWERRIVMLSKQRLRERQRQSTDVVLQESNVVTSRATQPRPSDMSA